MKEEGTAEERKNQIKAWLNDKFNLCFIGILIFAFAVRIYYFILTKNQPLWWDEADYMAYAKNLAGVENGWTITPQHNSLFPYLAAGLFRLGLSEAGIRFILEFIPSFLTIFLAYYLCILMFNSKKIALITSFLLAVFWEMLFNSFRFHLEGPALFFGFLSIYIFWQGYERKELIFGRVNPRWAIPLTVVSVLLTYSLRRGYFLFGVFFLVYMLFTRRFRDLIKDKYNWIGLLIAICLFFAAENLIFTSPLTEVAQSYTHFERKINLFPLKIFSAYFLNLNGSLLFSPLLILCYLGFILIGFDTTSSFKHLKNQENRKIRSEFFMAVALVITLFYFLVIARALSLGDIRWYYPLLLSSLFCISRATLFIADILKKYSKFISILLIVILIGYGGYYELQHADFIIKAKIPAYSGIKQAGLFLKQVSQPTDVIFSGPDSQPSYYAERKVVYPSKFVNKSSNQDVSFNDFMSELIKPENDNVKYFIVTFSEPNHPLWMKQPEIGQETDRIEIPFMDTIIYLNGNQHVIRQSKIYGNIEFKLLNIFDDAFVYEIKRI